MKIEKFKFDIKLKLFILSLSLNFNSFTQVNLLEAWYNCSELYDGAWNTEITANIEDGEWIMIFEDNFDGNELDKSKWFTCGDGWNCGRGPTELQYYKEANCIVNDGVVKLTAKGDPGYYDTFDGNSWIEKFYPYTSGWLQTKMKFEYGFYEISAKVPKGKSFWPAFWFYGCPVEIDVFEFDGNKTKILKTNVIDWGNCSNSNNESCKMNDIKTTDFSEEYHKYSLEWDQYKLIFRVDGNIIYRKSYKYYSTQNGYGVESNNNLPQVVYQKDRVFPDNPAHLILNFALGDGPEYDEQGNLVEEGAGYGDGPPDETTVFPSSFDIEYVRVWKKTNDNNDFSICDLNLADSPAEIPAIVTGKKITVGGPNCITNVLDDERLELIATEEIIIKPEFNSFIGSDFTARIHTGQKNNFDPSYDIQELSAVDKAKIEIEISPNPIKDFFKVEFNGHIESVEIIDLNGRIIQQHKKPNPSFSIDFSRELQGIYFVNLKTINETITKKLSNFNPIKTLILILVLTTNWVFSQKKMMVHPSVEFQFGPAITNYRSDQNFDYTNYFCYSYFGQLSNRFNLKKNSLELSFGFGNSHFRYARKYLYASAYESSRVKYQTYLLPIHLTYFFNTKSKIDPFFGAGFIIKSNHSVEIIKKYDDGHIDTNYGVSSLTAPLRLNLGVAYTINSKLSIRAESSWNIKLINTQEYFYKPSNFFIGIFIKLPDFEWK